MAQVCGKCSHVNPSDAAYCYWDGAALAGGHSVNGGPVNAGSAPFPGPFVFPTGQQCRNFDQLAMACQQNWAAAVDLLRQGFLASFLGGLGRADLAMAAQEAARYPDHDRGLDQLLAKLPTQVLQPPRVKVEPREINLGVTPVGTERRFEIHLTNQGMRLLYGSVVSDCKWLVLGEPPGNAQKLFQFGNEGTIQVHVRGQYLRAGNKPLEGHLVVESNGGQETLTVRVEVPVRPFKEGVLAGAISPRQIAEKAKAQPKEAAALFERGNVAQWFKDNGWTYPVQGPSAAGLGAVQQFFEALGLATAPKVEVTEKFLNLQGAVGQTLQATIEVKTAEKRPVYAHATCDQSWVDVSKTNLNGRIAIVQVVVPGVPPCPGQTLQANINITANGNQRFVVPLNLTITGNGSHIPPVISVEPVVQPAYGVQPALVQPVVYGVQPAFTQPVPVAAAPAGLYDVQPVGPPLVTPVGVTAAPFDFTATPAGPAPTVAPSRARRQTSPWVHLAPAGVLLLILLIILIRDWFAPPSGSTADGIPVDPNALVAVFFADGDVDDIGKPMPDIMTFGLVAKDRRAPGNQAKKLTFDRYGRTNSTVLRIDGQDRLFGFGNGRWEKKEKKEKVNLVTPGLPVENKWKLDYPGTKSIWMHDEGIQVTQTVEIVPGEPVETGDGFKSFLDTARVLYTIENVDQNKRDHKVGLRIMVDTLIGIDASNDGVPFTVPGEAALVDRAQSRQFDTPNVPAFIQVLEKPDLKEPGVIGYVNLKIGSKIEPPGKVLLTRWPGRSQFWDIPVRPFEDDSAVVIYWNERDLKFGEKREVGFSYGLGNVSSATGQLGISVGGLFTPGGELTVVALVSNPQPNQTVSLHLPDGFSLMPGEEKTRPVPPPQAAAGNRPVPVTWQVRAGDAGRYDLKVESSTGSAQKRKVNIRQAGIFGG